MFTEKEVLYLSQLVKLNLSQEEISKLSISLSESTSYLDLINELDTSHTEPTYQVSKLQNVFQKDNLSGSKALTLDEVLSNSSTNEEGYISTKGVLPQE